MNYKASFLIMPEIDVLLVFAINRNAHARFIASKTSSVRQFSQEQLVYDAASFLEAKSLTQRVADIKSLQIIATDKFESTLESVLESILPGAESNFMVFLDGEHLVVTHTESVIQNAH